jgi:hypothetical protein
MIGGGVVNSAGLSKTVWATQAVVREGTRVPHTRKNKLSWHTETNLEPWNCQGNLIMELVLCRPQGLLLVDDFRRSAFSKLWLVWQWL